MSERSRGRARRSALILCASWGAFCAACGAKSSLQQLDESNRDGGVHDAAAGCDPNAAIPLKAQQLFFLLDISASMKGARWSAAKEALEDFISDPRAAGVSVGLGVYPTPDSGPDFCLANLYSTPQVPLGPLSAEPMPDDAQEMLLATKLEALNPSGGTPLVAALEGTYAYLAAQSRESVPAGPVLVLLTDHLLTTWCDDEFPNIIVAMEAAGQHAANALMGPGHVVTHVVLIESDLLVKDIARAGGGKTVFVEDGSNLSGLLYDAFVEVTSSCRFRLPAPRIALRDALGDTTPLFEVSDPEDCGDASWHRDSKTPTFAVLCPALCERVERENLTVVAVCEGDR